MCWGLPRKEAEGGPWKEFEKGHKGVVNDRVNKEAGGWGGGVGGGNRQWSCEGQGLLGPGNWRAEMLGGQGGESVEGAWLSVTSRFWGDLTSVS